MGVVYLANPKESATLGRGQGVAFGQGQGTAGARRFEREAELLGRLQHPGIAQIFESGTTPGEHGSATYIAMEYVDGTSITEHAREHGLDTAARVRLLIDLVTAVHHAHMRGVLHRDLKPSNVLVTEDGRVKVIDFGVARALDSDRHSTLRTTTGQVIGTLAYMSPEQIAGDVDRVDSRTDVYALGVMAYELLSDRLPHDLQSKPLTEIARILKHVDPAFAGGRRQRLSR